MARRGQCWNLPIPVRITGRPGLHIEQLLDLLDRGIREVAPAFLVLHLGANDIGRLDLKQWICELTIAIYYIRARWPDTFLVWSDMLPRSHWRNGSSAKGAENARKRNQRRARHLIYQEGGAVIHHPLIQANVNLLQSDGVHLTDCGQAVFQDDLEAGLLSIMGNLSS